MATDPNDMGQQHLRNFMSENQQIAGAESKSPKGDVKPLPIRVAPIRSSASLQRALDNAEGDDDINAIKARLNRRGYDTSGF